MNGRLLCATSPARRRSLSPQEQLLVAQGSRRRHHEVPGNNSTHGSQALPQMDRGLVVFFDSSKQGVSDPLESTVRLRCQWSTARRATTKDIGCAGSTRTDLAKSSLSRSSQLHLRLQDSPWSLHLDPLRLEIFVVRAVEVRDAPARLQLDDAGRERADELPVV